MAQECDGGKFTRHICMWEHRPNMAVLKSAPRTADGSSYDSKRNLAPELPTLATTLRILSCCQNCKRLQFFWAQRDKCRITFSPAGPKTIHKTYSIGSFDNMSKELQAFFVVDQNCYL